MRSLLGPQDGGPSGPESVSPKTRCVILSQNCSFSESSGVTVRPLCTWLSSRAQSRQVLGCGPCWPWPAPSASKESSPAGSLWVERVLGLCCNLALSIKSKMILFVTVLFFLYFLFFIFFIVVDFVIHWNETAMGLHVFPIPIPLPPPSPPDPSRSFSFHQIPNNSYKPPRNPYLQQHFLCLGTISGMGVRAGARKSIVFLLLFYS